MAESDQAIRDIVAQLQGVPAAPQDAPVAVPASWAGPEVTPTMQYAAPGAPLSLAPPSAKAAATDWTIPTYAPAATPQMSVAPMGAMVAAPRGPTMGALLQRR